MPVTNATPRKGVVLRIRHTGLPEPTVRMRQLLRPHFCGYNLVKMESHNPKKKRNKQHEIKQPEVALCDCITEKSLFRLCHVDGVCWISINKPESVFEASERKNSFPEKKKRGFGKNA